MIYRAYKFTCDTCGKDECYVADNIKEAKQEARSDGFIMRGKQGCFCSKECFLDFLHY